MLCRPGCVQLNLLRLPVWPEWVPSGLLIELRRPGCLLECKICVWIGLQFVSNHTISVLFKPQCLLRHLSNLLLWLYCMPEHLSCNLDSLWCVTWLFTSWPGKLKHVPQCLLWLLVWHFCLSNFFDTTSSLTCYMRIIFGWWNRCYPYSCC